MEVTCLNLVLVRIWKNIYNKGGGNREVAAHLCLTLIVKELKISVEHGRVVTTLDIMKTPNIIFSEVVGSFCSLPCMLELSEKSMYIWNIKLGWMYMCSFYDN